LGLRTATLEKIVKTPRQGEGLGERFYLILSTNLSISHPTSHE